MQIVELLKGDNKKATIANVQNFFLDEDKYPTIRRRSGDWGIKSPQNDITGIRGSRRGNGSEKSMIEYAEYTLAKRAVDYAIAGCSSSYRHPSQQIIKYRYIQGLSLSVIKERINKFGNSTYYRADDYACLEFADCLEAVCERLNVDSDIIPDLRAKNRKKTGWKEDKNGNTTGDITLYYVIVAKLVNKTLYAPFKYVPKQAWNCYACFQRLTILATGSLLLNVGSVESGKQADAMVADDHNPRREAAYGNSNIPSK